jgi:1,2-dihydroxy-3-keto-5-methylthiopentene dioxygenase
MSNLQIFHEQQPQQPLRRSADPAEMTVLLQQVGVRFEQWRADQPIVAGATQEQVLAAYRDDIQRLIQAQGYQTVDVISLNATHPDKAALRKKFLDEHTHSEDEVRFFVAGRGLFTLHIDDKVYEVLCEKGDLIGVPANTRHWFDMGPEPDFVAIRFFNNPDGWVARYTDVPIATRFSRLS